jgi:predicted outer membrane repeat protein
MYPAYNPQEGCLMKPVLGAIRYGVLLSAMCMAWLSGAAFGGQAVYVDDDAKVGGDGSSWNTAFDSLQAGLQVAADSQGGVTVIRVGQGRYVPSALSEAGDARSATFALPEGVSLVGGYAGIGAADPDARDVDAYPSILSGDLLGDDGPPGEFLNDEDNAYHVVTASKLASTTVLDGFVITGGNACCAGNQFDVHRQGGGLHAHGANMMVMNCTLQYNKAYKGGGAYEQNCEGVWIDCVFLENWAQPDLSLPEGGGLRRENSSTALVGCVFAGNKAKRGGAIYLDYGPLMCVDCVFEGNVGELGDIGRGGAVSARFGEWMTLQGCQFIGNESDNSGGAVDSVLGLGMSIHECVFNGNSAALAGGAIEVSGGWLVITSSQFIDNVATDSEPVLPLGSGGALFIGNTSEAVIADCLFDGNFAGNACGAIAVSSSLNTRIQRCDFLGNFSPAGPGAVAAVSMAIDSCRFIGNATLGRGGAIGAGDTVDLSNCLFSGNGAYAGSIYFDPLGGAIHNFASGTLNCANCTFHANVAADGGGALYNGGVGTVNNCIFWSNAPDQVKSISVPALFDLSYCDIQDGWAGAGENNISVDPGFTDPQSSDFQLAVGSPCVDAGDNKALPAEIETDLIGNPRFVDDSEKKDVGGGAGPIVDLGALERQQTALCPADCAIPADGVVDIVDLFAVLSAWGSTNPGAADVNQDGVVGVDDLFEIISHWGDCPS